MTIFYRSYNEAAHDVARWEPHLPEFSAVAGVPRSGLHIAAMIGQIRHVPVIALDHLVADLPAPYRPKMARKLEQPGGPVLLVDDTSHGGYQMKSLTGQLRDPENIIKAALYATRKVVDLGIIDLAGYWIPCRHHTFHWNAFRDSITSTLATDMDGVLAADYHGPDERIHEKEYLEWMRNTACLLRPRHAVQAIVTARLDRYRPQTEEWLRRHRIDYAELWMRPSYDFNVGAWKSAIYKKIGGRVSTFVESEHWLAKEISDRTRYSVIAWKSQHTFRNLVAESAF
jgi:orotate phosphoribosyltransferase